MTPDRPVMTPPSFLRRRVLAAGLALSLMSGVSATALAQEYDVLIRGGMVYDGTGAEGRAADVAIKGERIVEVGAIPAAATATTTVDATGKIVSPGFIDNLKQLLQQNDAVRKHVMFEITESSRIENLEATNNVIQDLRSFGHKVCLDDFGAGAAAFQYLRTLQVDCVKIDGFYVQESTRSDKGKAFLRSIAMLCHDLDIETVGEMIEDEKTARYLQELGVHYGQGYLFGRPEIGLPGIARAKHSAA